MEVESGWYRVEWRKRKEWKNIWVYISIYGPHQLIYGFNILLLLILLVLVVVIIWINDNKDKYIVFNSINIVSILKQKIEKLYIFINKQYK